MFKRIATLVLLVGFAGVLFIGCNPYEFNGEVDDPPIEVPVVTYYDISFNLDGGQGSFTKESKTAGSAYVLPSTSPTRAGYIFKGWKVGTKTYQPGGLFTVPTSNVTFVAQWQQEQVTAPKYMVTYNGNGGTPTSANGDHYEANAVFAVGHPTTVFTRTNHILSGWSYNSQTYTSGATFTMPSSNVTFVAQWQQEQTTDPNQGTVSNIHMSEYVTESLLLTENNDDWTIHGTTASFAEQVRLQIEAFTDRLSLRLDRTYGGGATGQQITTGYAIPTNTLWMTNPVTNIDATSGDNGSIYNIADYARNLDGGEWGMRTYLGANVNLLNAIQGGYQFGTRWGVNYNTADSWVNRMKTMADISEMVRGVANVVAYGEDKGLSLETALANIDHLGFTTKDQENIVKYVLDEIIGTNNVKKDDARLASIEANSTVVNGLITQSSKLSPEEHYYKAYRLLVGNMVEEEVDSCFSYKDSDTDKWKDTDTLVYKHTADGNGILSKKQLESSADRENDFDGPASVILKTSAVSIKNLSVYINSAETFLADVTVRVVTNGVEVFKTTKSIWVNSTKTTFLFESTNAFNLGDYNGSGEKVSVTENSNGSISAAVTNTGSSYIEIIFGSSFEGKTFSCELGDLGVFTQG